MYRPGCERPPVSWILRLNLRLNLDLFGITRDVFSSPDKVQEVHDKPLRIIIQPVHQRNPPSTPKHVAERSRLAGELVGRLLAMAEA